MSRQRAWRLLPAVLLLVSSSACSPPPPPTAETERLEEWLLTAEDVGIGLSEQSRGSAGVEGGRLCPDAAFEIEDHGVVRVELTQGAGRDLVSITESLWAVEAGEGEDLFAGLSAAQTSCDRQRWTDYGETYVFTALTPPAIGDDSLAGRLQFGEGIRGDGPVDDERTVTIRKGDIVAEFTMHEILDGPEAASAMDDEDFYAIVIRALEKLPE
ncbi:MAG TPA: hypothetical protein VIW46_13510 [Acidimicrobiia bacterium]|jgi:hypothetical protein